MLTFEEETDTMSRNVGKKLSSIAEDRKCQLHHGESIKSGVALSWAHCPARDGRVTV